MNKKLIPYLLFAAHLWVVLHFWYLSSWDLFDNGPSGVYLALGRLSGLLLVTFTLLQFILVGRVLWVERLFGLDRLSRVHRYVGEGLFYMILAHPILITMSYSIQAEQGLWAMFLRMYNQFYGIPWAVFSFLIFQVIIAISIPSIRRFIPYDYWRILHMGLYVAVALSYLHQVNLGGTILGSEAFHKYWLAFYVFVIFNFLWYRYIVPSYSYYTYRFKVDEVKRENDNVVSIYIRGKNLSRFRVVPGQFGIFRFLDQNWWQAHPFTISAVPENDRFRITVKDVGDFTHEIPNIKVGTKVMVEGPYGIFTDSEKVGNKVLLIAGGIGITPIRSLAVDFSKKGKDQVILYGARAGKDFVLSDELQQTNAKLIRVASDDPTWPGEKGQFDAETIKRLVPDIFDRYIFLCGPPVMMNIVRKTLIGLGVKKEKIQIEKFAL